jgi:DNA invertase Pin-like site-specific DNA recombinase
MNAEAKVTTEHLQRSAYLYVRQSTLHQVLENTESTERQYALRQRAVALGWPQEQIVVIDHDQAQSGASASDRAGFQRLVGDVGLGKAGIVMGLEVSRLARNCADWHRLLEICALTHTLILDEDGLYDPVHYNDRLLLGLKGTMSEAELHILKARMIGGMLNKAQRGELKMPLPIGLVYDDDDRVELDPDQQIQQALRVFFATFARTGSAWKTMQAFNAQGLKFPRRGHAGGGEIVWQVMTHRLAVQTLHNPRYAGVYCFGRRRQWTDIDGKTHSRFLPREQWRFVKKDAHPGYLTWDEFLSNQQRLIENHQRHGTGERRAGPPREGPALLQGLLICGKCGRTMTVRYHQRADRLVPDYVCTKDHTELGKPLCQTMVGAEIDEAIGKLLVESVTPLAMEAALDVQHEIQARLADAARLRHQHVQRAQYEADQARLRYMRVDPNHRLVADTLEARWNEKLRVLAEAKEECEKQERLDASELTSEHKNRIRSLASEFPKLWQDPNTLDRDRKRMARLLLEDVTLRREQEILVQVRFKGGATHELRLPLPRSAWERRKTKPEIVGEIDRLLDQHNDSEVARLLNERGLHTGCGGTFDTLKIIHVRRQYGLKDRRQRLRDRGWMTPGEAAALLKCRCDAVSYWQTIGLLTGVHFNAGKAFLYQRPSDNVIVQIHARQRHPRSIARNPRSNTSGAV